MSGQPAPFFSLKKALSRWSVVLLILALSIVTSAYYTSRQFKGETTVSVVPLAISAAIFFAFMLRLHYLGSSSRFPLMRTGRALLLAAAETVALACLNLIVVFTLQVLDFGPRPVNPVPSKILQAVDSADDITLYAAMSLSDDSDATLEQLATPKYFSSQLMYGGEKVHGEAVLGQTDLGFMGKFIARRLIRQMSNGGGHACIMFPHHLLRLKSQGHTYFFVICYQCGMVIVYEDSKRIGELDTKPTDKLIFDAFLRLANVPLSFDDLAPAQIQAIGAKHNQLMAIQARKDVESAVRWATFTPSSVRALVAQGIKLPLTDQQNAIYSSSLQKEYPDQNERVLALLDWLGSDTGIWQFSSHSHSPLYEKMGLVIALLDSVPRQAIVDVIQSRALTAQQMAGAARALSLHRFEGSVYNKPELPEALRKSLLAHLVHENVPENLDQAYIDLADE
jgi:hypothetical protein